MSSYVYVCKNCGRRYTSGGTLFSNFCCKGCKLEYEQKKAGNFNSGNNSDSNKSGPTFGSCLLLAIIIIVIYIIKVNH